MQQVSNTTNWKVEDLRQALLTGTLNDVLSAGPSALKLKFSNGLRVVIQADGGEELLIVAGEEPTTPLIKMEDNVVFHLSMEFKKLHALARMPKKAHDFDAAWDISSVMEVMVNPGETANIDTGIAWALPEGFYATINGRSSMNKRGILCNRGVIDATYTGSYLVALTNTSSVPYKIEVGDRIAQVTIHKVYHPKITEVTEFSPGYSKRAARGFGSSGR